MLRTSFVLLALFSTQLFGSVIRVPADAQTIQIAIFKAQPFDTIIVAPGTYSEAINYSGKVIVIQSENPDDPDTVANTIIDAGGLGSVVTFAGTEGNVHTALNGFTVRGGTVGIAGNGTTATIRNCVIRDNSSSGIKQVHGDIDDCIIRDNNGWGLDDCDGLITLVTIDNSFGGMQKCDGVMSDCKITNSRSSYGVFDLTCYPEVDPVVMRVPAAR